jgi:hypothetical protein
MIKIGGELLTAKTGSGAHQVHYPIGTGVKRPSVKLATHLHLVLRSIMVVLFLHLPHISSKREEHRT